jgi:hypothetical protein
MYLGLLLRHFREAMSTRSEGTASRAGGLVFYCLKKCVGYVAYYFRLGR